MKNTRPAQRPHKPHKIRILRIEAGMSQADLGRKVGLSRQAINQIEAGIMPRLAHALKISKVFNSNVEAVFGDFIH